MKREPTTYWAKLERDEDGRVIEWHPLLAHSADVAAVTEALLTRTILGDRLARLAGIDRLQPAHIARLAVLAAIHDAGKVNRGFQAKKDLDADQYAGHVGPMISVLEAESPDRLLRALGIERMLDWFEDQRALIDMLCATWGHHGRPIPPQTTRFEPKLWQSSEDADPASGLESLASATTRWFPKAFQTAPAFSVEPGFRHAFNGVLNLADWLGSTRRFFDYADADEERIDYARQRASELIRKMHLDPHRAREVLGSEPLDFNEIAGFDPYEIQSTCMELPISKHGNLTVLESDTGSGKTEAALARFVRLYQAGQVDGMYFAVPTRSAATQLFERIQAAMSRLIPDVQSRPSTVLAVPGYIRVDEMEGDPDALPGFDVQWPDDEPDAFERGWAAESSRRYLAGAVAVGTVDQVLLSALQVKYAHLRVAALSRQFLVVDEVHSSDPYMRRILQRVLDLHLSAGGHALLMSATLATDDRHVYTRAGHEDPPSYDDAVDEPYPLVTHVDASRRDPQAHHARSSNYSKLVELDVLQAADHPAHVARAALQSAQDGARVLVIRNLVADCVDTQRELEALADDPQYLFGPDSALAPHHSRYAPGDRRALDAAIESSFGKESNRRGVVVVATQTVEQSLDIDADILLTDLCPADVLLQRIGRLHRHEKRSRPPGFDTAKVRVLVPDERDLSECIVRGGDTDGSGLVGPHGLGTVYRDLRILEATWRRLESDDTWTIPRQNRPIVERTMHPVRLKELVEELGEPWSRHEQYILGERFGEESHSQLVTIDWSKPFTENGFLSDTEQIKTRLGNDDLSVEFEEPQPGPFDRKIYALTIPQYWFQNAVHDEDEDLVPEVLSNSEGRLSFTLNGQTFEYDRFGLHRPDTE